MIFVVHPQTRPVIAAASAGLVLILVGVQILDERWIRDRYGRGARKGHMPKGIRMGTGDF